MNTITPSDPFRPETPNNESKKIPESKDQTQTLNKSGKNQFEPLSVKILKPKDTSNTDTQENIATHTLTEAVTQINDFVQSIQRELHFSIDDESGDAIVKVIDKKTNELVRQIPPEDVMEMLKNLGKDEGFSLILKSSA